MQYIGCEHKKERPDNRFPERPTLTMKNLRFFVCKYTHNLKGYPFQLLTFAHKHEYETLS